MLTHTSSSVVVKSTRSDLSFRATRFHLHAHKGTTRNVRQTLCGGPKEQDPPYGHPLSLAGSCLVDPASRDQLGSRSPTDAFRGSARELLSSQQPSVGTWDGTPTSSTGVVDVPSGRLSPAPAH